MRTLIIASHPYAGSFNAAVAAAVENAAVKAGGEAVHINLVEDGFNPVMTSEELLLWSKGETSCPLVKKYQAELERVDIVAFPFPVWWGGPPAVLKGFCDKVLTPGFAYSQEENGELTGKFIGKRAVVITTMQTPSDIFSGKYGDPVTGMFIKDTLETCGFEVVKHFEIDGISELGKNRAEKALDEITDFVENLKELATV